MTTKVKPMRKNIFLTLTLIISLISSYSVTSAAADRPVWSGYDTAFDLLRAEENNFCDPKFVGGTMSFMQNMESDLDDLLNQIHIRFGINFVAGPMVGRLPINIKSQNVPWTSLLRSQLFVLGVGATCVDGNTIQLVKNDDVSNLERAAQEASKLETKYIKLKYLQPSSSGNRDIAGRSTSNQAGFGIGGCQQNTYAGTQTGGTQTNLPQTCKFERLMTEIRQILGLNGDTGQYNPQTGSSGSGEPAVIYREGGLPALPYVGQVPGRNMLLVKGNKAQIHDIEELIKRADVPPFQVVIKGLVYTANENKLRDIGVQSSAIVGTGNLKQLGGITSQPNATTTTSGTGSTATTSAATSGQLNPGGVRTLGPGFLQPAGLSDSIFGVSAIIGTAQFTVQATALEQNGVISVKSRPFATVLDGDATDLTVGRQVPVIVQAINSIGGQPGTLQILQAANLLSVTPHVIDDENGSPVAVSLELQLESNDVNTSVISQGVPSVAVRSIQSKFILNQEQTLILGGFTVDSDSKTVTKTPGIGDIPLLGELFKRRVRSTQINRLYFAISVTIMPNGTVIEPVKVPGMSTDLPSITPEMQKRSELAEPKSAATPTPPAVKKDN